MPIGIGTGGLTSDQVFKLKTDNELLAESIYNILTTRKGERVGNREFGTDLCRQLFNPNVEQYWEAIKLEIVKDIELFEPRVIVLDIQYVADYEEQKLSLYVTFLSLLTQTVEEIGVLELQP